MYLGLKPRRCFGKPATDHLSYGRPILIIRVYGKIMTMITNSSIENVKMMVQILLSSHLMSKAVTITNMRSLNFACGSVWVLTLVSDIKGGT
jgi:hypothetical protein